MWNLERNILGHEVRKVFIKYDSGFMDNKNRGMALQVTRTQRCYDQPVYISQPIELRQGRAAVVRLPFIACDARGFTTLLALWGFIDELEKRCCVYHAL
jgi:hypothetical protein